MPDSDVIADATATLRRRLVAVLNPADPARRLVAEGDVVVGQPRTGEAPKGTSLVIFLFEALEDPSARNRPNVREVDDDGEVVLKKPPMAILLRYMLIPYAGDGISEQKILGRVLQAFYDEAILSGTLLEGGLAGTREALKVTLAPMTLEDRTRVWHAVQKPFKLAVTYEVRVVNLDTETSQRIRPVKTRLLAGATEPPR